MRRVRRPKRGSRWRLGCDAETVTDELMRREFCDSHLVLISHFGWVLVAKPVESPWAPHATRYAGTRFAMRVRSEGYGFATKSIRQKATDVFAGGHFGGKIGSAAKLSGSLPRAFLIAPENHHINCGSLVRSTGTQSRVAEANRSRPKPTKPSPSNSNAAV